MQDKIVDAIQGLTVAVFFVGVMSTCSGPSVSNTNSKLEDITKQLQKLNSNVEQINNARR